MKTKRDEPLEEIWEIRRRIAQRYNYDPHQQAEDLKERQAKDKERLSKRKPEERRAAAK